MSTSTPPATTDAGPEENHSDSSKLRIFVGILKKSVLVSTHPLGFPPLPSPALHRPALPIAGSCPDPCLPPRRFIGVADLASVRFSLPSQLLEPTPNLEYWNYLDAPNAFIAIGTSDDPLDRMLEVLRFWFTKDLKYAKGKPCKPYNSCLGEFFRVLCSLMICAFGHMYKESR